MSKRVAYVNLPTARDVLLSRPIASSIMRHGYTCLIREESNLHSEIQNIVRPSARLALIYWKQMWAQHHIFLSLYRQVPHRGLVEKRG